MRQVFYLAILLLFSQASAQRLTENIGGSAGIKINAGIWGAPAAKYFETLPPFFALKLGASYTRHRSWI
jgi:hypothetical protein